MTICRLVSMTILLLGAAGPLAAQPPAERLHELRMERLRQALALQEDQAEAVARAMEEVRRAERQARESESEAIEQIRSLLRSDPVNQNAVRFALEAIERERENMARVRREQAERLKQRLTPEQQAKLMLFNRQFERRLWELMAERRGGSRMGRPGFGPGPGRQGLGPRRAPAREEAPADRP